MATPYRVYVYNGGGDGNPKPWTRLHSYRGFEYEDYEHPTGNYVGSVAGLSRLDAVAGNNELVALVEYNLIDAWATGLYRSEGFGGEEEIVWDIIRGGKFGH
ncbi:unnamed protein product [Calypogeia fissa]